MRHPPGVYGLSVVIGATGGTICAYNPACGELSIESLGDISPRQPTEGQLSQVERAASQTGRRGVQKMIRSLEKRLAEHEAKLESAKAAGGYTSHIEGEIENYKTLIQAAKDWLDKNP
jgi:hypothetical protein